MAEEPSLRDLKKAGRDLNMVLDLDPVIDLTLDEDALKALIKDASDLLEPGDKITDETKTVVAFLTGDGKKKIVRKAEEEDEEEPEEEPEEKKEERVTKKKEVEVEEEETPKKKKAKEEEETPKKKVPPGGEVEQPKGTLTVLEAMKEYGKSKREIRMLGRSGEVDVKKVGARVFYPEKALTDYFKKHAKDKKSKKEEKEED